MDAALVERHFAIFEPDSYLPALAIDPRSLFENRIVLRQLPCTDFVICTLSDCLIDAIESGKRFRTFDCLKVIKHIVKYGARPHELSSKTIDRLFFLYRNFIFSSREEVQWCVSVFVKDQKLNEAHLKWLRTNWKSSTHFVNRLLRYPGTSTIISSWAAEILAEDLLPFRRSELLGTLIDGDLPPISRNLNPGEVLWGIFYSKTTMPIKTKLLLESTDDACLEEAFEIALRLSSFALLKRIHELANCGAA
ncbi:hypothetical protein K788_00036910 (plasmid) [Paraburkholderia caribensis MBA4]|uniref:Uncharacterized protein n=1 Tax=Paraburkholderia caribensis MBA4 TaxID=1323664 RepID=A0A0P0RRK2_9BURK|nr:hypothetical protein [Paraburkholderia caribensis]ALL71664.1 hypothetical protein K788_00036910 [Paraburkholderia caribensis MBA4]